MASGRERDLSAEPVGPCIPWTLGSGLDLNSIRSRLSNLFLVHAISKNLLIEQKVDFGESQGFSVGGVLAKALIVELRQELSNLLIFGLQKH